MNKKFLGALLLGSLVMGGTFVSCQDYDDDIKNLQEQIDALKPLKDQVSTLQGQLGISAADCQSKIDAAISALQNGDVKKALADAADAAAKAAEALAAANDAAAAANDAAAAAGNASDAAAAADAAAKAAQETADAAKALAQAAKDAADAAQDAADAAQGSADGVLSADDKAQIAWVKENAEKLATVADLQAKVNELTAEIAKKQDKGNYLTAADLEQIKSDIAALQAAAKDLISKRLTSLVFAPQTYIDGIETINFATFKYDDWGTAKANWLRDDAGDKKVNENNEWIEVSKDTEGAISMVVDGETKYYAPVVSNIIGDNSTTAQYLVSPAGVTLDGIKELSFIAQDEATNQTRAIGAAPIKVVSKDLKDGILTLKLAKTDVSNTLGDGKEEWNWSNPPKKFTIVSLKATLADTVLTAAEKGAEVNVFSDWTRLTESTVRPFIANNEARNDKGELVCGYSRWNTSFKYISHFVEFTAIYHREDSETGDRVNQVYDTEGTTNSYGYHSANPWIYAKEHIYSEPLDLLSLVTVCAGDVRNNNNEIKNYKDYGLEFEFNLMDHFYVKNQNATKDYTDQQLFAKLDADGHTLIATSRDGQEKNADAVGRTPVIQVVLKDVANNAVVDVRYFKVLWTESEPISKVWVEANELAADGFECTGNYETFILEKYMNNMYANIVPGGMTKDKFHGNRYIWTTWINNNLSYSFFAYSYTETENGEEVTHEFDIDSIKSMLDEGKYDVIEKLGFGNVYDLYDAGQNRTHNLKIEVDAKDYRLPQTEQDFTIKGWFFFQSNDGYSRVIIPATFDVKKGTIVNKYNYLETQWQGTLSVENADKTRPANPTLISDKTLGGTYNNTTYGPYKTTQLICDITYGYMAGGKTPTDFHTLAGYKSFTWKNGDDLGNATTDVVFDADRLSMLPSLDGMTYTDAANKVHTFGWAVANSGKTLYYAEKDEQNKVKAATDPTAVIAAQIDATGSGDKRVYLCDTKTNTNNTFGLDKNNSKPTDAALLLVGQKVPVKVTATRCNTVDFDKYLVWFIDPLKWTAATQAITLKDALNAGDAKEIKIGDQFVLQENFGSKTPLYLFDVFDNKGNKVHAETKDLNNWYGVENITMDAKDNWLINIDANGSINDNSSSKLTQTVVGGTTTPLYDLQLLDENKVETRDIQAVKYVKYHNNSGQAITKNIVIKVPVSLDTKWKKSNKNYITVTITPNI